MRKFRRFLRLLTAQGLWLRGWMGPLLALGLLALALAAAWLERRGILGTEELYVTYQQWAECYLPLWALVAGSVVWSDAEPHQRPLLLSWPVRSWELGLAKALAVGLVYALMAATGAICLSALMARAGGSLPGSLVFLRALLSGALLLGLASVGCALSAPGVGLVLGATWWFLNMLAESALWLDAHTHGALHLLAWTRGGHWPLDEANKATALVALVSCTLSLMGLGLARRIGQR